MSRDARSVRELGEGRPKGSWLGGGFVVMGRRFPRDVHEHYDLTPVVGLLIVLVFFLTMWVQRW